MAKCTGNRATGFLFRGLPQNILIGTASDRYAGWIGQIYSEGRYEKGITRRSHKVGDKTFNEETLPVESVSEYFEHFPLLEIDYTFYLLLLEKDGKPTQNFHVLKSYRQHMKDGDFVLLKAPQIVIARKPKRCIKICKNITPTLPSPLRGGGVKWGAKVTKGEVLLPSIKSISAA